MSAYISRFKGIVFLGVLLGALIFILFRYISQLVFITNTSRIGITGRYRTESLPPSIVNMIGEGLTQIDESGNVVPKLARSWETPDKGKTWVFQLDEDTLWQDGEKLTSDSVNYTFSDVEIERPDEKTIVFKLQEPFSVFPTVVSRPTFKQGLLGTGEWKVLKISLGFSDFVQELTLVNQEKEKRLFKFYPTEEQTKLAFKLGEVDEIRGIFNPNPFTDWPTAKISKLTNENRVVVIFFDTQDSKLSDKSLRQTLAYSMVKSYDGERAISPISPNSWAHNPTVKDYDQDIDRARKFIDELPEEFKQDLSIKLVTTPVLLTIAEKIADDWENVGVKTQIQVSSGIPIQFQAFLAIFDTPTDPDQYSIWHSTQTSTNISKYRNPRIDKLLEDGRVELDIEGRKKIYLDFQRFLVEDSPAVFLYHPSLYKIERK